MPIKESIAKRLPINFNAHMYNIIFNIMYTIAMDISTFKYLWKSTLIKVDIPLKPFGKMLLGYKNKLNPSAIKKPPTITSKLSTKNARFLFLMTISFLIYPKILKFVKLLH